MRRNSPSRAELLQGTFDILLVPSLLAGPDHGQELAERIQWTTEGLLQIVSEPPYPVLHRPHSENAKRRLSPLGRTQLRVEPSKLESLGHPIQPVLNFLDQDMQ